MSKVLIVAEHLNDKLNSSTARCVTCARELKATSIDVLVLADAADAIAAEAANIDGVSKVLTVANAANAHALGAVYAPQVAAFAKQGYTHVFAPSTAFGKDVAPCVAALLGVA
jgi:electron transfer flavoprotein alpha subunit